METHNLLHIGNSLGIGESMPRLDRIIDNSLVPSYS